MTPPRPVLQALWVLHRAVNRLTRGRIGTREARGDRLGTLFLHTVGRRTGQPRATALFYMPDGGDVVVVASNGGSETDPAWWRNLRDQPDAEVEVGGRRRSVHARAATADEGDRLWPRLVAANPAYASYRSRLFRPIPIVILEPR